MPMPSQSCELDPWLLQQVLSVPIIYFPVSSSAMVYRPIAATLTFGWIQQNNQVIPDPLRWLLESASDRSKNQWCEKKHQLTIALFPLSFSRVFPLLVSLTCHAPAVQLELQVSGFAVRFNTDFYLPFKVTTSLSHHSPDKLVKLLWVIGSWKQRETAGWSPVTPCGIPYG